MAALVDCGINSAAAAVFTDSMIVNRITGYQRGYPHVVASMVRSAAVEQLVQARGASFGSPWKVEGTLPRLAIAAGDAQTLKLLFDLKEKPQYRSDRHVKFVNVMQLAVQLKRVDMLKRLVELLAHDPAWQWEPHLFAHAMCPPAADPRTLEVLEWLHRYVPQEMRVARPHDVVAFARIGNLEVIRWLFEHGYELPCYIAGAAALSRNADLLAYLYQHTNARCDPNAVVRAASIGDLEVVKIAVTNQTKETCEQAINAAARFGHLDVVRYFVENGLGVQSATVIDKAVSGRHLQIVSYLNEHLSSHTGCTARALETAAILGDANIVEFLCTERDEGDVGAAMVIAARRDRLNLAKLLYKHLRADDSAYPAVKAAVRASRNDVVRFLCTNQELRPETPSFLVRALAKEDDQLVCGLLPFSTMAELEHARDAAIKQQQPASRVQILERWIRSLTRDAKGKRR